MEEIKHCYSIFIIISLTLFALASSNIVVKLVPSYKYSAFP
uniref:Uncharacterized protein n=1 Tax=Tetranychus urticae TaxID=32264 RepID=T1KZ40_TETUR